MHSVPASGKDYFVVDAEAAEQAMQVNPDVVSTARANRAFLGRTTSYLVRQAGIRQFLEADLREPQAILTEAARTLDFSQPVAVMLLAVLPLIGDDEGPYDLVRQLTDGVGPGS